MERIVIPVFDVANLEGLAVWARMFAQYIDRHPDEVDATFRENNPDLPAAAEYLPYLLKSVLDFIEQVGALSHKLNVAMAEQEFAEMDKSKLN